MSQLLYVLMFLYLYILRMYVCMYVRVYGCTIMYSTCTPICMYNVFIRTFSVCMESVCVIVRTHVRKYGRMTAHTHACIQLYMYVICTCMNVCESKYMHTCTYSCAYGLYICQIHPLRNPLVQK